MTTISVPAIVGWAETAGDSSDQQEHRCEGTCNDCKGMRALANISYDANDKSNKNRRQT